MSVHGIVMIQVGMLEPFSCDKETIASIRRDSSFEGEFFDPWFPIIFPKKITDRVITTDKRKITIKRIVFFEVGIVPFIDCAVGFEFLVDLLEEGGGA